MAAWILRQIGLPLLAVFLVMYNLFHIAFMIGKTPDNDFSKAWYSTVAFLQGGEMYGYNESIPAYFGDEPPRMLWNLNPPHYHLIMLPFGLLPLMTGVLLWAAITLVFMSAGLYWLGRELKLTPTQRQLALLAFLGFVGTQVSFMCGHCTYLLFVVILGMWTAARREQWVKAGLWFGVGLSVKPFLLILVPYLLLRRRWDALGAAAGMVLACFAVGVAVFGVHNHLEWLSKFQEAGGWAWLYPNGSLFGLFSRSLAANPLCPPILELPLQGVKILWLVVGIPIGVLTLWLATRDSTTAGIDRALALLLVAALLLSPLGWAYYFCLPMGPVVMVAMRWWRERETSSPWSRRLVVAGGLMLLWPVMIAGSFQPSAWATLLIGNLYSYGTLLVWLALAVDGWHTWRLQRCGVPA